MAQAAVKVNALCKFFLVHATLVETEEDNQTHSQTHWLPEHCMCLVECTLGTLYAP